MQMTDPHARTAADCLTDLETTGNGLTTTEAPAVWLRMAPRACPKRRRAGRCCALSGTSTTY